MTKRRSKARNGSKTKRVASLAHPGAKRPNIPTAETQSYMREEEQGPKTRLYPRNPDLDPQLVWRGKDEQDQGPLAVETVPIYIQEKVHPKAIIDDLLRVQQAAGPQPDLFADFNGLHDPEAKLEFYSHALNWSNRMILGDSLLVMNSLAEKEKVKGRVQMIYMDPPYGIKFGSNWQVSTKQRDVKDGKSEAMSREPEVIRAFRDTWPQVCASAPGGGRKRSTTSLAIESHGLSARSRQTMWTMRPPGLRARRMLRRPATGLAKNIVPNRANTKSNWPVGSAISASPRTKVTLASPRARTAARAKSRNASQQSIPTTLPVGPTLSASFRDVSPKPQPTSSTWSPSRTGSAGNTASLCRDSPSTRMCLKRMNLGASTSFQKRTNAVSSLAEGPAAATAAVLVMRAGPFGVAGGCRSVRDG